MLDHPDRTVVLGWWVKPVFTVLDGDSVGEATRDVILVAVGVGGTSEARRECRVRTRTLVVGVRVVRVPRYRPRGRRLGTLAGSRRGLAVRSALPFLV